MVWPKTVRLGLLAIAALALLVVAVACGEEKAEEASATPTATSSATPTATSVATPTATSVATPSATSVETPTATSAATPTETGTPAASACVVQEPPEGQANMFRNPGFESGAEPWCSLHPLEATSFEVSQDYAHSGQSSALLRMRVPAEEESKAKVFYLVQEVAAKDFPELISGYYRVENWVKGTPKQYLQFVVILCRRGDAGECALGATNLPGQYNHQIRYPLAGISEEPFEIYNARFVFISRDEPKEGEWVYFERNIKQDFQELWGAVPEGFDMMRVLFEVRYDDRQAGTTPSEADVYYDDLYMGPASENPNKP